MALKIRLSRGGSKKRPFYKIVVAEALSPRDGKFIERLGSYNPMVAKDHAERMVLNVERAKYWISKGAQPTLRVAKMLSSDGLVKAPVIRDQPIKSAPGKKRQEREAEAAEKAALADLEKAKLNLERTIVKLPFQGIIRQKKTGVGQFVGTGSILATAFSTEEVLIALPLTDTELSYLGLPLAYEEERPFSGPKVNFYSLVSNKKSEWEGRIVRTAGSIDPLTRLVYVYAEVINPYQQSPPLAIGMFVDAVIEGKTIKNGFLVPNSAINNNSNIYVINTNDNLEIRKIEVLGTENDYVIIKGEISEGKRVVVSPLNNAKEGMALKPILLDKNIAR